MSSHSQVGSPEEGKVYTVGLKNLDGKVRISGPSDIYSILSELRNAEVEIPVVMHVDSRLNLKAIETCAIGSMMSVSVEARTIFANAVRAQDDRSIILVHNHAFQREVYPSLGDKDFLQGIKTGGRIMGIHVHDSVIVGTSGYYSFMEHGISIKKDTEYKAYSPFPLKKCPSYRISSSYTGKVSSAKKVVEVAPFLRQEKSSYLSVVHMTPDMEVSSVEVLMGSGSPEEMAKTILRSVISTPSTKYFILVSNKTMAEKRSKIMLDLQEVVGNVRLGSTVLCVPLVDVILLEEKGFFSYSEHGEVFPKTKAYLLMEDEGLKLKGPCKTGRADIPPYSWTFR